MLNMSDNSSSNAPSTLEKTHVHSTAAVGFGDGARYEKGRPSYPSDIVNKVAQLIGRDDADVLDLAAGTGRFV